MKEAYRYLYIIAATCLLGIGSGFVTLIPNYLAYDKEASFLKHKVENSLKVKVNESTSCNGLKELVEECNNALYLLKTSESYASLLMTIATSLFWIALVAASVGVFLNLKVLKDSKNEKKHNKNIKLYNLGAQRAARPLCRSLVA